MSPTYRFEQFTDKSIDLRLPEDADSQSFTWMGRDHASLAHKASTWCTEQGGVKGDIKSALQDLLDFARKKCFRRDQDSFWLEIRLTHSSPRWKIPRPHQDGRYWSPDLNKAGEDVFKVGTVLCGPGTLFWDVNSVDEATKEKANWVVNEGMREKRQAEGWSQESAEDELKLRDWQAATLKDLVGIRSPALGEAVIWNVGTNDTSAIHSEPDMSDMPDGRIL
jgi:hypothetical protein